MKGGGGGGGGGGLEFENLILQGLYFRLRTLCTTSVTTSLCYSLC